MRPLLSLFALCLLAWILLSPEQVVCFLFISTYWYPFFNSVFSSSPLLILSLFLASFFLSVVHSPVLFAFFCLSVFHFLFLFFYFILFIHTFSLFLEGFIFSHSVIHFALSLLSSSPFCLSFCLFLFSLRSFRLFVSPCVHIFLSSQPDWLYFDSFHHSCYHFPCVS